MGTARGAVVVAERVLLELVRARRSLVFWAAFPAAMLLLFGLIYAGNGRTGPAFDSVAPGILIGAALFFSCLAGPVSLVVGERERGTLRRLLLAPLPPTAYVLGVVAAFAAVAAGQTVLVYGLALPFGGRYHGSWWLGPLIVTLTVTAYSGLGIALGARLARRAEDVTGPVAAFGVPLLVLGGTFFPPRMLPPWLYRVAWLDPIFHMNEALRAVSARGAGLAEVAPHVAFLAALAGAAAAVGAAAYGRMLEAELGRG